jgi:hypothetical protein
MNKRILKLALVLIIAVTLFAGLNAMLGAVSAAQTTSDSGDALGLPQALQNPPDEFPVVTHAASQEWVGISGDCVVFRDNRTASGGVYLHNLSTGQTFAISEEPDEVRKVVVSQGVVVWRSERVGARGLWGYYNPSCSDAGIFGNEVIDPFYIVNRGEANAPALSRGEMLTFDTLRPKGAHYVAFIELDSDDDGTPDPLEPWYDPGGDDILVPISWPFWEGGYGQRISDIYWGDDYKVACWYSDSGGVDQLECLDLNYLREPDPWNHRFVVTPAARPFPDYKGLIAVHRDLVVWTDYRDFNLSGYDLYIADLDPDDDGILNPNDPDPGEGLIEFVLVNRPWHQEHPDIWWPFAVWTDGRNSRQQDIYAYDLSLDSDGDGIFNWKDPNRTCIDPAELRVTSNLVDQNTPELWDGTVVWIDGRGSGNTDIYGAHLQPVEPQPRVPVSGTSQEKAIHWLDKQTVQFPEVADIPGYDPGTGRALRYKSYVQDGAEQLIQAWYDAIPGSYLVSFDFCYFGTPDQKRYLGRFGRGFTYDQALTLIARTMLSQPARAKELGHYVSSFQNDGQLATTDPGSFGFSFNGQGFWGEKDNFYDMNYLRGGANGWLGYGYLFYSRRYSDTQFLDVMTGLADYLLTLQVTDDEDDPRYGLFKGGYGRWYKDLWFDEDINWVSTEHNIDIYFFLRDLGKMTGTEAYTNAANLLRENLPRLWNDDENKRRLDRGVSKEKGKDPADALDAASWGAMYWTAVGDLDKAMRSLEYADNTYSNTVTISNTLTISPEITIWGYKPYTGTVDAHNWSVENLVWSEGSLGVAMANLKLGYALVDHCDDFRGYYRIWEAQDILAEMEKLQGLDPEGGLFYAGYTGTAVLTGTEEITDFARAPSAAGVNWLLMVQQAIKDNTLRDAFWGPDAGVDWSCPEDVILIRRAWLPVIMKGAP